MVLPEEVSEVEESVDDENRSLPKCSTTTNIVLVFIILYIITFVTSIVCLIICIVSKMNAIKEAKQEEADMYRGDKKSYLSPFNTASPQSLEMQERWLRHKAMIRDNRRGLDDDSKSTSSKK